MNNDIENIAEEALKEDEKDRKERKAEKKEKKNKSSRARGIGSVRNVIDGSLLINERTIKQLPFILYIVLLGIFYIGNRYKAEKIVRETNKVQSELKELRSEQIAVASELMQISKQSIVLKLIEEYELNLVESTEPPKIIKIDKD